MILRPYQLKTIEDVRAAYRSGSRRVCLQIATGGGKTATAAELIRASVARGRRVLFAAHLDALLDDTLSRLRAAGLHAGLVQADRTADPEAPVQVASTATLAARGVCPPADLVILDECHRACARTVREILAAYPRAHHLGLTATPQRGDGQPLGDCYDALVCGPSLADLTAAGWLVPARVYAPAVPPDGALARDPVEALAEWAPGRVALVFARDAEHARDVASRVPGAVTVLAESDRAERAAGRDPAVRCIVTCRALLEGWDRPDVSAVVLCQGFSTVSGYLQAIGRGLRASPGKRDCVVVDLRGAVYQHGLPADPRRWSLEGEACRSVGDEPALRRCARCHAVFPLARRCPLCGATGTVDTRPVRVQRAEMWEASALPLSRRRELYRESVERKLLSQGKPPWLAAKIADKAVERWGLSKERAA